MSTSFVLFTGLEIFIAFVLILEFKNKQRLIDFEDRVIRLIRISIKKRAKKSHAAKCSATKNRFAA